MCVYSCLFHGSSLDFSATLITVKFGARNMHIGALVMSRFFKVLWLQLAMLIVAEWLLDRNSNSVEDIRRLLEDSIHFFQGAIASFGEEKVHKRENERISVFVSWTFVGIGVKMTYMTAKII